MDRKIIIRFDDICPSMNWDMWFKADEILRKYNVKPLIGVVPDCKDNELMVYEKRKDFWEYIKKLQAEGYVVAMHGYNHVYDNKCKSLVSRGLQTEFAGHPFKTQLKKIKNGKDLLLEHGIKTDVFFAPSHSYDINTLKALKECGFRYVSDGMTLRPIERNGIVCVPCRSGGIPRIGKRGLYTVVLHTNTWAYDIEMKQFKSLIDICNNYNDDIVDFYYVANNYTSGFNLLQLAEEQRKITYERDIRPKLSKIKRKILKIGG